MSEQSEGRERRRWRWKASLVVASVFALAALVAACGDDDDGGDGGGSGETAETVKVGVIVPQTGPFAASGNGALSGAEAGAAYLNAGNSESGVEFQLIDADDKGDPSKAATEAAKMASEGVIAFLASTTPGSAQALQTVANRDGILTLSPGIQGIETEMTPDGKYPWVFGTGPAPDQLGQLQPEYAAELGEKKIGEIYVDDPVGQDFHDSAGAVADELGLEIVSEPFAATQRDVSAQLGNIRDAGVDTLLVWAYGTYLVNVSSSLVKMGWEPRILTVLGSTDPAVRGLLEQSAPDLLEEMLGGPFARTYMSEKEGEPASGELAREYPKYVEKATGEKPTDFTGIYLFDAMIALDKGIAEADSTDPEAIREALSSTPVEISQGTTPWPDDRTRAVPSSELWLLYATSDLSDGAAVAAPSPK